MFYYLLKLYTFEFSLLMDVLLICLFRFVDNSEFRIPRIHQFLFHCSEGKTGQNYLLIVTTMDIQSFLGRMYHLLLFFFFLFFFTLKSKFLRHMPLTHSVFIIEGINACWSPIDHLLKKPASLCTKEIM